MIKLKRKSLIQALAFLLLAGLCFYVQFAFAQSTPSGFGGIASNIQSSFGPIAKLITGMSFLAGLGFAFASILKFKAHKDNPTQIPIGTPIALLLVAAALMFLPFLFRQAGKTLFGSATVTGVSGVSGLAS